MGVLGIIAVLHGPPVPLAEGMIGTMNFTPFHDRGFPLTFSARTMAEK